MADWLRDISHAETFVQRNPVLRLLQARPRTLVLILAFLQRTFKDEQHLQVPYATLQSQLAAFLEDLQWDQQEEGEGELFQEYRDYEELAHKYLQRWIDAHFLHNVVDDDTKQPQVVLSKHTEKVFQMVDLLDEREFVGAESKFRDLLGKLQDLVEQANPDTEMRLAELERRRDALEAEIRQIKVSGRVTSYEDFQVKSRFEEVGRLANELVGDFKEVEDNFREITRYIYEQQEAAQRTKGQLLADTFDALAELRGTEQGKSFYAFRNFMLDDTSQEELARLAEGVYSLLEDRQIEVRNRSLRRLKYLLHQASRKVLEKNNLLAEKLSREVVAREIQEKRKLRELMADIRRLALERVNQPDDGRTYLTLDGAPSLSLPMERGLNLQPAEKAHTVKASSAQVGLAELQDLARVYRDDWVDKKALLRNLSDALEQEDPISLGRVVALYPLTRQLPELLAYVSLLSHAQVKADVNADRREDILFDAEHQKYLNAPLILFTR